MVSKRERAVQVHPEVERAGIAASCRRKSGRFCEAVLRATGLNSRICNAGIQDVTYKRLSMNKPIPGDRAPHCLWEQSGRSKDS